MEKTILVAGGAGYIGSHMVRALLEADYQTVVFDNLSTGHRSAVPEGAIFIHGDLRHPAEVEQVFQTFPVSAVMHFAASSIVPESVRNPLEYYKNNTAAFVNLLEQMLAQGVDKLVFSSTAAVYGEPKQVPIKESSPFLPSNPYGRSKAMMEQMLADLSAVSPLKYVTFRYFNAAGAHPGGETGENHEPETHLIPNLLAAAAGDKENFTLFGNDYVTRDGTCVRDYVHVTDLCSAHLLALRYLEQGGGSEIFNLGSEQGCSVREMIRAVEEETGRTVPVVAGARREGDPSLLIADAEKARALLGWEPRENLRSIIRSAFQWYENSRKRSPKGAILAA